MKPSVILVLSEAFFDLSSLPGVDFSDTEYGFVAADGTPSAAPPEECEAAVGRVEAVLYDAFYGERYITDEMNARW